MASHESSPLLSSLTTHGYVVVPSLLPHSIVTRLHTAAAELTKLARSGQWPYLRTVPKQFPPWPATPGEHGIWGVQHLLHPDAPGRDVFAQCYFGDEVLGVVAQLLERDGDGSGGEEKKKEGLVMELFNLLVGTDVAFALRWHRDDVSFNLSPEDEARALGLAATNGNGHPHAYHAQYNIALLPDSSLQLIPGSHARARTDAERVALKADPHVQDLPGMCTVTLQPGDAVFYDNNVVHRGVYAAGVPRLTLHGSVGAAGWGGRDRARNVLQHGIGEWVGRCDFCGLEGRVGRQAEGMRDALLSLGRGRRDVEFAHED